MEVVLIRSQIDIQDIIQKAHGNYNSDHKKYDKGIPKQAEKGSEKALALAVLESLYFGDKLDLLLLQTKDFLLVFVRRHYVANADDVGFRSGERIVGDGRITLTKTEDGVGVIRHLIVEFWSRWKLF